MRTSVNDRTETIIPSRRAKMATADYATYILYNIWEHIVFLPSEHQRRSLGVGAYMYTEAE